MTIHKATIIFPKIKTQILNVLKFQPPIDVILTFRNLKNFSLRYASLRTLINGADVIAGYSLILHPWNTVTAKIMSHLQRVITIPSQ